MEAEDQHHHPRMRREKTRESGNGIKRGSRQAPVKKGGLKMKPEFPASSDKARRHKGKTGIASTHKERGVASWPSSEAAIGDVIGFISNRQKRQAGGMALTGSLR